MRRQIFRKVALDRLSSPEQLDELLQITSPAGWLALAALGGLVLAAVLWSLFGTVTLQVSGPAVLVAPPSANQGAAGSLGAVVSVPVAAGLQVRPGMEVRIYPAAVDRQSSGFLRGSVVAVESPKVTQTGAAMLTDKQAPPASGSADAATLIRVALMPDASAPSGYHWSLPPGPPITLDMGTAASATIILARRRPISFVLPLR